ncbi:hypothetical protein STRDD04_01622 [Streptococcus sp. DD04]|nr:hypothetical protein STRDD04_01622 [Streptococcus sp. DD04]
MLLRNSNRYLLPIYFNSIIGTIRQGPTIKLNSQVFEIESTIKSFYHFHRR